MSISYILNPFTGNFDAIDSGGSYWQDPVATFSSLPLSDPDGTSRIVKDEDAVYTFDAGSTTWIFAGKIKIANVGSSPSSAGYSVSANNTLTLEPADATHPGVVTTGTQNLAGNKTFIDDVNVNSATTTTGGLNVRTEGDGVLQGFNIESNNSSKTMGIVVRDAGDIFFYDGDTRLSFSTSGKGGTGPASPRFKWDVTGSDTNTTQTSIQIPATTAITNIDSTAGNFSTLAFVNGAMDISSTIEGVHDTISAGASTGHIDILTMNAGTLAQRVRINSTGLTATGTLSASNFSGSSSGTNTGDVTLTSVGSSPNANAATLTGQVLNLQPANASFPGVMTTGTQQFSGAKTFPDTLVIANDPDGTKQFEVNLNLAGTGTVTSLIPLGTANVGLYIQPNVDTSANILTQNATSGQVFIGANSTIGASNSGIQYSDATTANRAQIKLHSYVNATSVAGVSTLTSRSGTVGVNAAVVAGQDYSKWTAQAGATTAGSAPISGTWAFKANTVNSLTVTSDFHLQLTNLAGTLGDRLILGSEGALQLPNYTTGIAHFDSSGNITSSTISLTTDVSGTLPIGNGGTGQTTKTTAFDALSPMSALGDIIYGGASGTGTRLPASTDGKVLTLASGIPSWVTPAASGVTIGTIDSQTKSANGLVAVAANLYAQTADTSFPGMVSTGTQSFAGAKTFTGTISASNFSGTSSGTNTGDQTITLTGDVTGSGTGTFTTTLATVNGNVGSFGSSTSIPSFTVNAKGLITAASGNVVIAPAGTLTGTTLNSTVVSSSLTSVGTITSGTWNGTTIDVAHGGTGDTSFNANQVILGGTTSTGALTQVPGATAGFVLTSTGTTSAPTFQAVGSSSPTTFGTRASPLVITAGSGLVASTNVSTTALVQVSFVQGTGSAPVTITANPAIAAGTIVGQMLYIIVPSPTAAASTLTIPNQSGAVELNGNWTGGPGDSLHVMWDGTAWTEIARNI